MNNDMRAFKIIERLYNTNYMEHYDALYHYMLTYIEGPTAETFMFLDEVENLIGLNNHRDVVDYIINEVK